MGKGFGKTDPTLDGGAGPRTGYGRNDLYLKRDNDGKNSLEPSTSRDTSTVLGVTRVV